MRFIEVDLQPDVTREEMREHEICERRRHSPRCSRCGAFARLAVGVPLYDWQGEYDPYVDCARCGRQQMGGPN